MAPDTPGTAEAAGRPRPGALHHVELWVPDLARAEASWGWLLAALGYRPHRSWPEGRSWRLGHTYLVIERSPALTGTGHDRCRAGLNHLAFHVRDDREVDRLVGQAPGHGWRLLFEDRHPYAGEPDHYAAYLEDVDGFEVELVAIPATPRPA